MKAKTMDLRDYINAEYGAVDREYIAERISSKDRLNHIRRIKSFLIRESKATLIKSNCEAYGYFLGEYRNAVTLDDKGSIIIPETDSELTRKLK